MTRLATSEAHNFDEMFRVADKAVYLAKDNARNRVEMVKKLESSDTLNSNNVAQRQN